MDDFISLLQEERDKQTLPEKVYEVFFHLYDSYIKTLTSAGIDHRVHSNIFFTYLKLVKEQLAKPYRFAPYHQKITYPFDYYAFGVDLFRPMVDHARSKVCYLHNVAKMIEQMGKGENVVLFANHQSEVDPYLISIALEGIYPQFAADLIYVAGDRVVTDPLAVPLSKGRNLLCIYSKRHIDNPPEKKEEKQLHNQRTMKLMRELLTEGGKAIYVAPSGGRDRANAEGEVILAPFDAQSIEMFYLMARQARQPTHFYPLALKTYDILPPPSTIELELGEKRLPSREGVYFAFGDEIDMEQCCGCDVKDRHTKRLYRADYIFQLVKTYYQELL